MAINPFTRQEKSAKDLQLYASSVVGTLLNTQKLPPGEAYLVLVQAQLVLLSYLLPKIERMVKFNENGPIAETEN